MRGLTRRGIKHVCFSCLLQARHQDVLLNDGILAPVSSQSMTSIQSCQNGSSQRAASIASFRKVGNSPPARIRYVSQEVGSETTANRPAIELSEVQQKRIHAVHKLRQQVSAAINTSTSTAGQKLGENDLTLEAVLNTIPSLSMAGDEDLVKVLKEGYGNKPATTVDGLLRKVAVHRNHAQRRVSDRETAEAMATLGFVENASIDAAGLKSEEDVFRHVATDAPAAHRKKGVLMNALVAAQDARKAKIAAKAAARMPSNTTATARPKSNQFVKQKTLDPEELILQPLAVGNDQPIPKLSYDLSRVLFNPGIYQLQDPRSRVFNFDPYLAEPMPVSEFNFGALNKYITSSKDATLIEHATNYQKRYIGSSSSMSGALCQFHFLLSQFRPLNTQNLTRGFSEERTDFTMITRAPAAVFLRWKDGVYAVDADKEFDEPNVLLSLGKSMEKLLTLEKSEFEKWRKTGTATDHTFSDPHAEAYHYSAQGRFLLRSQLDARDSRLPGTGVFDLKTRAVAGIRMNVQEHETGMGYQIKDRYGNWESFEREYYDMMRSAFLKYAMQVRMGNMDGIFVAYHNIQRLFGFQYIPITELDLALHGQSDPSLGDQEFRMSISLMDEIFEMVTAKFPEQSIRFHFDTRDTSAREQMPYMHIFAEPMTDEEIDAIQVQQDSEFEAYEKKVTENPDATSDMLDDESASTTSSSDQGEVLSNYIESTTDAATAYRSSASSDANPEALDRVLQHVSPDTEAPKPRPLLAIKLTISNKVNDIATVRPEQLMGDEKWTVDYALEEVADSEARKIYITCKNRRMAALRTTLKQNREFISNMRELSQSGATWRQEQDEIDAQREQVVLYST